MPAPALKKNSKIFTLQMVFSFFQIPMGYLKVDPSQTDKNALKW